MATQAQQRKTVELKPGVSLDNISEGDIIVYNGLQELMIRNSDNELHTLKRLQRNYSCPVVVKTEREITDYQQELGRFAHCCGRADGISQKGYPAEYDPLDKMLKEAGL